MGTAPDVVVYTQMLCGFCYQAKRLLDDRGVVYREIDVTGNPGLRAEMTSAAGGARTAPQILGLIRLTSPAPRHVDFFVALGLGFRSEGSGFFAVAKIA